MDKAINKTLMDSSPNPSVNSSVSSVAMTGASSRFEALRLSLEALPLLARVRWALWREPFPAFHAAWNAQIEDERSARLNAEVGNRNAEKDGSDFPTSDFPVPTSDVPTSDVPRLNETGEPDADARREAWECAHAVSRAARWVPRASCLTQALVLQRLLARRGYASSLFLGVDRAGKPSQTPRPRAKGFEAHAWVEWRGRVLIGGDISRWTPLPLLPSRAATPAPDSAPEPR